MQHNDRFVSIYPQWVASGGALCVRPWCGLYGGAAYMLMPESSFDDFGVVRLTHRVAYIPKITVILIW